MGVTPAAESSKKLRMSPVTWVSPVRPASRKGASGFSPYPLDPGPPPDRVRIRPPPVVSPVEIGLRHREVTRASSAGVDTEGNRRPSSSAGSAGSGGADGRPFGNRKCVQTWRDALPLMGGFKGKNGPPPVTAAGCPASGRSVAFRTRFPAMNGKKTPGMHA
ncbi:MAG: hypothetical protein JWM59_2281 [Verrucomicrobiales bacterium]|nr:hypothetical protein [Verrucomicrobiales bacterium]